MTERLPFADKQYDAVMSNVAAHMFSDEVTRRLLAEVKRVLRYGGLLLLHVNSEADRELRAPRRPVKLELEQNYVLEESGQTVRFFSARVPSQRPCGLERPGDGARRDPEQRNGTTVQARVEDRRDERVFAQRPNGRSALARLTVPNTGPGDSLEPLRQRHP